MSARLVASVAFTLVAVAVGGAACEQGGATGPQRLTVTSDDYEVRGEFTLVKLDRVDAVNVENGRLVLKGVPADVVVDLPSSADPRRPARHWALVTDAHVEGHRLITFTESESVKDISIELPDGDAPLHFDVFTAHDAGEVLVFATGDRQVGPPSLYGHISIKHKQSARGLQ